jgi:uncharacterized protein with HEPN domain
MAGEGSPSTSSLFTLRKGVDADLRRHDKSSVARTSTFSLLGITFVAAITRAEFAVSKLHQNAVIRSLEVIGEAAANVSGQFRDAHPEIPWREIIGMRNRLIHSYSNVSLDIVWDVSCVMLPELIAALRPFVPPGP